MSKTVGATEQSVDASMVADAAGRLPVRKYSSVQLLIALIAMIVITPFVEPLRRGDLIETGLMTAVFLSAVVATGARKRTRIIAVILVTPVVFGHWIIHYSPHAIPKSLLTGTSAVFIVFVVVNLLRFVLRASEVDVDVLCAASSAYLMLGVLWSFAYALAAQLTVNAFIFASPASPHVLAGFESLYFSFAALSTLGCSDIVPTSNAARLLAMTEAMVGVFFMTILIARLVTLYPASTKQT